MTAHIAGVGLLAFVHGRHVNSQMILLPESAIAEHASIGSRLLMYGLHVFLQMILALEAMRANGTNVGFASVRLLVDRRLVDRHDVSAQVVALQKALVTLVAPVGLDFGMHGQNVLGEVMLSGELMGAHLALEGLLFLVH